MVSWIPGAAASMSRMTRTGWALAAPQATRRIAADRVGMEVSMVCLLMS
jgi:hypothetical protein